MAKPVFSSGWRGAPEKGKKTFKKKERKSTWLVYVQASFNNTIIRDHHRHERKRFVVEEFRIAGLPRIAEGDAVRGAAGRVRCRQYGARSRGAQRGCAGERTRVRA